MKKKIVLCLMCGLTLLGLTVGCGKKNNDEKLTNMDSLDLSNLTFKIDNVVYNAPIKISDFINNGWIVSDDQKDILAGTVNDVKTKLIESIPEEYRSDNMSLGNGSVYLQKDGLNLSIYFDMNNLDINVIDAKVVALQLNKEEHSSLNFDFYGISFNSSEQQVKDFMPSKNYEVLENGSTKEYRFVKVINNCSYQTTIIVNSKINKVSELLINFN